jgi:hypothetical protein
MQRAARRAAASGRPRPPRVPAPRRPAAATSRGPWASRS